METPLVPIVPELAITGFGSLYYFELAPGFFHPPEYHSGIWEMVFVDDGELSAEADAISYRLHKGQVIFHQPGEIHAHHASHQGICNILVLSFSCSSALMSHFRKKIFTLEKGSQKILSLFLEEARDALGEIPSRIDDKSALDFSGARQGAIQLMQCYLVEFLFSLIRCGEDSVKPMERVPTGRMAESQQAEAIENYILEHVCLPASLAPICQEFSMSRTYLCRVFKEGTGRSPIDFWIEQKIREAKKLIRQDEMNITQIAELLGYTSIHHFSRMFKRLTGLSPTAYKNSVGQWADQ